MNASRDKIFKVLILTDSRGKSLQDSFIERAGSSSQNIVTKVIVKPGCTFEQCVEKAVSWGHDPTYQYDAIVIQAGICDFTERERQGRIKFLKYVRQNQTERLEEALRKLKESLGRKALVATIIPASLKKYLEFHNQDIQIRDDIIETAASQQADLIKDIQFVNNQIIEFNKSQGNRTIDLHDRVFSSTLKKRKNKGKIKRSIIFKDSQLNDGVHPNEELNSLLHKRTWDVIEHTANEKNSAEQDLVSSQESSQSDLETWDFKRPRLCL